MSAILLTTAGGIITDTADATLQNFFASGRCGAITDISVTNPSGLDIYISSGYVIICGRLVEISSETIAAPANTSAGKVCLEVNVSGSAKIKTVSGTALTQENLNAGGAVYQLELADFSSDTSSLLTFSKTLKKISSMPLTVSETAPVNPQVDELWAW